MTKRIFLLLAGAFVLSCLQLAAQAVITFPTTRYNFGTFAEEQKQSVTFIFKNEGDKPLVIHQATASCGCTTPSFTATPILPGQTGEVKVSYNGRGKRAGKFLKSITIRSNAKNNLVRLLIEGEMVGKEK